MAKSVIGALRVSLGIDSAQFSSGLKKSQSGMAKFAKAAAIGFAAVSAAATGAFLAIRGAADRADQAWKSSQSIGIPIKELGRLQHAADLSGVSFTSLERSVRRTAQAINDSTQGIANTGTKAFDRLGIALKNTDGSARTTSDVLGDVAEVFAKMPDGATKTALAYEMFGRTGLEMIPMLNMGRDGIKQLGDEAERLGLVFDEKTARAAEAFNDNMRRLQLTVTGLWNRVLAGVIPAFERLSERFVAASQEGGVLDGVVAGITGAMNLLVKGIVLVFDNLHHLYDLFKVFVAARIVLFLGSAAGAMVMFARTIRTAGLAMALVTTITRAKITAIALLAAVVAKATGTFEGMVGWIKETGRALMDALPEGMRDGIDGLAASLQDLALGIDATDEAAAGALRDLSAGADIAANSFGNVGTAAKTAADQVDLSATSMRGAMESVGQSIAQSFSGIGSSIAQAFREGGDVAGGVLDAVLGKINALADRLIDMAFDQAIQGLLGSLMGAFSGGMGLGGGGFGRATYGGSGGFFPAFPGFAGGTMSAPGGMAWVGEKGPELVNLPRGSQVIPNDAVNSMGSGGAVFNIDARGAQRGVGEEIRQALEDFSRFTLPNRVNAITADPLARG